MSGSQEYKHLCPQVSSGLRATHSEWPADHAILKSQVTHKRDGEQDYCNNSDQACFQLTGCGVGNCRLQTIRKKSTLKHATTIVLALCYNGSAHQPYMPVRKNWVVDLLLCALKCKSRAHSNILRPLWFGLFSMVPCRASSGKEKKSRILSCPD